MAEREVAISIEHLTARQIPKAVITAIFVVLIAYLGLLTFWEVHRSSIIAGQVVEVSLKLAGLNANIADSHVVLPLTQQLLVTPGIRKVVSRTNNGYAV